MRGAALRTALIEAAARLVADHGPDALTVRRVAAEVGASTMAVYTHFGSMEELRRAIRREGFDRLARAKETVDSTDDPVADLSVAGATYTLFALLNPNLYRAMFFETPPDDIDAAVKVAGVELEIIKRCIAAGRFSEADPWAIGWQCWAATHGVVAGLLSGMYDVARAEELMRSLGVALYVGFGDDAETARRSIARADERVRAAGMAASARDARA